MIGDIARLSRIACQSRFVTIRLSMPSIKQNDNTELAEAIITISLTSAKLKYSIVNTRKQYITDIVSKYFA